MTPEETKRTEARRNFLAACGKFAAATPPAITLMLVAAERNYAVAASGTVHHDGNTPPSVFDGTNIRIFPQR